MRVADIILEQLGGHKFVVMTGSKNFVADGDTLRMNLARNASKANRLWITLDADDTYTMRFFKYTAGGWKVDHKKQTVVEKPEKIEEVKTYKGIYCDQLQELFTETTGMYTHL